MKLNDLNWTFLEIDETATGIVSVNFKDLGPTDEEAEVVLEITGIRIAQEK